MQVPRKLEGVGVGSGTDKATDSAGSAFIASNYRRQNMIVFKRKCCAPLVISRPSIIKPVLVAPATLCALVIHKTAADSDSMGLKCSFDQVLR